jgi:hypothetical protein
MELDADGRKAHVCAGSQPAAPAENPYLKQPLNDATLDALHKLVARGGVAGHAAQEMLDAEMLGADDAYAARLRGRQSPPPEPSPSWQSRLLARWHAWRDRR